MVNEYHAKAVKKHIYSFGYHPSESALCKLESKNLFLEEEKDKLLFSDLEVEPSCSAFIKKRLDIVSFSEDYYALLNSIEKEKISAEGFKAEYLVFDGDNTGYSTRLSKLKDIGYLIEGIPDYYHPTVTYALCQHEGMWYFGVLIKNSFDWHKHKQKPRSYSNSISSSIAKALVNIAAKGNQESRLLDACCGVGTILLEACFAGYAIEGNDINWKVCKDARENLAHFHYRCRVFCADINDLDKRYDAAIVDLPYNLLSSASDSEIYHIIASTAKIADRLVIVSTSDIAHAIGAAGLLTVEHCSVSKKGKRNFTRRIWVCEKN